MAAETIKKFENGNTAYFECSFKNLDQLLVEPVSPNYSILNLRGELVQSGVPTLVVTGIYGVYFTPDETGEYVIEFTATIEDKPVLHRLKFKVYRTAWKNEYSSSSSSWSSSSSSSSSPSSCSSSSCSSSESSSSSSSNSSSSSCSSSSMSSSSSVSSSLSCSSSSSSSRSSSSSSASLPE